MAPSSTFDSKREGENKLKQREMIIEKMTNIPIGYSAILIDSTTFATANELGKKRKRVVDDESNKRQCLGKAFAVNKPDYANKEEVPDIITLPSTDDIEIVESSFNDAVTMNFEHLKENPIKVVWGDYTSCMTRFNKKISETSPSQDLRRIVSCRLLAQDAELFVNVTCRKTPKPGTNNSSIGSLKTLLKKEGYTVSDSQSMNYNDSKSKKGRGMMFYRITLGNGV